VPRWEGEEFPEEEPTHTQERREEGYSDGLIRGDVQVRNYLSGKRRNFRIITRLEPKRKFRAASIWNMGVHLKP